MSLNPLARLRPPVVLPSDILASVLCQGVWGQSFAYDAFGNIQKTGLGSNSTMTSAYMAGVTPTLGYSASNNQVNTAYNGATAAYDANGNQTQTSTMNLAWNALSQPVSVNGVNAVYDALGRLVETGTSAVTAASLSGSAGSITISGGVQTLAAPEQFRAFATVTITGSEQNDGASPPTYDQGGGELEIDAYLPDYSIASDSLYSFSYGPGDTPSTIAARLIAQINADPVADVAAMPIQGVAGGIYLLLRNSGTQQVTYYVQGGTGCGVPGFSQCSFDITTPSDPMTSIGSNTDFAAIQDAGTVAVTIAGRAPIVYAWDVKDTPLTIANALASAINAADGSILTATTAMSGGNAAVVNLVSTATGPGTNYPVQTFMTFNSCSFSQSSFVAFAAGMTGGTYAVSGAAANVTEYVYSPGGSKIAVVHNGQLVKGTVPLPGGETAIYSSSGLAYFRHPDWLGSSRLATTWNHAVYSKTAYAPYGETYNEAGTQDRSFTGQEQDSTAGLYDFLFRKYDPVAGRWLSPDPLGWGAVSQEYPQSLNRYAYVMNNPMAATDPSGLYCQWDDGTADGDPEDGGAGSGDCSEQGGTWVEPHDPDESITVTAPEPQCEIGDASCNPQDANSDSIGMNSSIFQLTSFAPSSFAQVQGRGPYRTPQQCQALANTINNLLNQIAKRQGALNSNPLNLPQFAPGARAGSVDGHQQELGDYIQRLANAANEYNNGCGGGPPGAPTSGSPAPSMPPIRVPPIMPVLPMTEGGITLGEILEWLAGGILAVP